MFLIYVPQTIGKIEHFSFLIRHLHSLFSEMSKLFDHCYIGFIFVFLIVAFESFLCILDSRLLSVLRLVSIFSWPMAVFPILFIMSFTKYVSFHRECLHFYFSEIQYFSSMGHNLVKYL